MVEPDARTVPVGVGAGRDMLLATRMCPPRPQPGWVPRPHLIERLRAGAGRGLVLVCGPAGFGKSSLLADWVRSDRRALAWLSSEQGDNDPVRFWRHVFAALDGARPGVADRAMALVGGAAAPPMTTAVTALVNDLVAEPDEVLLVIDDYHLIHAREVHAPLQYLVENMPSVLRLVLSSRSDPPLPLARLRACGRLTELRAADLRFTHGETAELLRRASGQDLPDEVVTALGERTEGWVAGLQLAALSLTRHSDVARFVEEFSGSHRFVLDYLTEEVLDRQPEELRTFLLETCVLERLSGSLCDTVCGRDDSQQLLESIERANLFLLPLDEERRWWRYHHLFAELLRARLLARQPARMPELHRAAAGWHEDHGLIDEAIGHSLAAGDVDRAARLVERHVEGQILRLGEGATLTRWLSALPPDVVQRRPLLVLGQAAVALQMGRLDEVESLLISAERACDRAGDTPYDASIDRRQSFMANIPAAVALVRAELARCRGDADREATFARTAMAHVTREDELLGSLVRYHVAVADWHAGRLADAERELARMGSQRSTLAERHPLLQGGYSLGAVQQARGRLTAAVRTYQRALAATAISNSTPPAGLAHVGLAEVLYERDDLVSAAEHALAGIELCRGLTSRPPMVAGLLTLARIRHAEGDRSGTLAMLDEAEDLMPQSLDVRNPLPALRARLALVTGDLADAAQWVHDRGLAAGDAPAYAREHEYMVLARVLLAEENPAALTLLAQWRALADAQDRTGSAITMRVLEALAHAAGGNLSEARGALAEALRRGGPEGYVRVFVDEGAPLAALARDLLVGRRLEHLTGNAVPRTYLDRLTAAFERSGHPVLPAARRGAVAVPGLVDPLSFREQEVLALLAAGHPNRAIAEHLVITLDTVKRHVTHVFQKLGVTNRTQAVARARQLDLLR